MDPHAHELQCPLCGQIHRAVSLESGQRAVCTRCGSTLAERGYLGFGSGPMFAVTGLILATAAFFLPFVRLGKFGDERTARLTAGFEGFWLHGFAPLGLWVFFCGVIAPFGLLVLLLAIRGTDRPERLRNWNAELRRLAERVQYWAMPEVQVLGVLVAFFKLGNLVKMTVGPGFLCYAAASLCTILAWRRFDLQNPREAAAPSRPA